MRLVQFTYVPEYLQNWSAETRKASDNYCWWSSALT